MTRKKEFLQRCEVCDLWFKSEAGYKAHRETNVTTRHGLCRTKGRRRGLVEGSSPRVEMEVQQGVEYEAASIPQMVSNGMDAAVSMHPFQAVNYIDWGAWMALQLGMTEQSMAGEPEPEIRPEDDE